MLKLSIIVPIYNVEPYLRKCVDSLLMQDLDPTEYEIILVDDGSPDGCPTICDEYATKSNANQQSATNNQQSLMPNIKVIHRPNGGLSAARNSGLRVAQGKYIQFVDSDDYLEPNVLGGLVAQMEREDLDVLRINYQNVDEKGMVINPNQSNTDPKVNNDYSFVVTDGISFLNTRMGYSSYAWSFIVKQSLLVGNQHSALTIHQSPIFFTEGIFFEDADWTPRLLLKTKRIASSDVVMYNYLYRIGSITKTTNLNKKKKLLDDQLYIIARYKEWSNRLKQDGQDARWFDGGIAVTLVAMLDSLSTDFYAQRAEYIRSIKAMHLFPLSTYHAWKTAKRKIWLMNISLQGTIGLLHIKNKL